MVSKKKRFTIYNGVPAKMAAIFIVSVLLFPFHSSAKDANPEIMTIQHAYVNSDFVGSLTDEIALEKALDDKIADTKAIYPDAVIKAESQVTVIPEDMIKETVNNSVAVEDIIENLSIKADAYEVTIDGEAVAYVAAKVDAEEVIRSILLQYVTEEELAQYEREKNSEVERALEKPGSHVTGVILSKTLENHSVKVDPAKLIETEEAVELINAGTYVDATYDTKDNETLSNITEVTGLKVDRLLELNPDIKKETKLKSGTELEIEVPVPYLDIRVEREIYKNKTLAFDTEMIEDDKLLKGETKITEKGKSGIQATVYQTMEINGKSVEETTIDERVTSKPVTKVERHGTKVVPSIGTGTFSWPADGGYISSKQGHRWGKLHKGIDIARPTTRTITAADNGIVSFAGTGSGYGNIVIIDHNNGYETTYAHLDSVAVKTGQVVPKGTKIGIMGSTGKSTGVHLHFEMHKNSELVNPLNYINQ